MADTEALKDAYAILAGIPAKKFVAELSKYWVRDVPWEETLEVAPEISCGTLGCAAGWLTLHPKFANPNSDGLDDRLEYLSRLLEIDDLEEDSLFSARCGRLTSGFDLEVPKSWSDKALVLYRFRRVLRQSKAEAKRGVLGDISQAEVNHAHPF